MELFFNKNKHFLRRPTPHIHPSSPLPDIRMKITLWKLEIWKRKGEMTRLAVRFSNNVSHSSDGILN